MILADKWVHPTKFTGDYPNWAGYAFLDYDKSSNVYHPGDDYNLGYGDQDLGQDVVATASGTVIHTSKSTAGYGNIIVIKHQLGYNLKRMIKQLYNIDTDTLTSFYGHLQNIDVSVGTNLEVGVKIGTVGKSGTTSAHLHFEIYAPIGELAKKSWRFYPVGWTKEKIKEFWLPAYSFIEASKQAEYIADTFLGKSKEYWLQVEKDREGLLSQIGEIDKVWAIRLANAEKVISKRDSQLLDKDKTIEKRDTTIKTMTENFDKEKVVLNGKITTAQNKITELLKESAKEYNFNESLKILFYSIFTKRR